MKYAKVLILKRPGEFDQPLSYGVPEQLAQKCQRGQGVLVKLKEKEVRGIIVELEEGLPEGIDKVKEIDGILPELSLLEVQLDAAQKIADYYHCSLLRAIKLFVPSTLWQGKGKRTLKQINEADFQAPETSIFPLSPLKHSLSKEQEEALRVISSSKKGVLLHGVTGSGKTEVYLRLILEAVRKGKQALMLVPEIALTPQTINYFQEYFGDHLAVFHSKLSDGERLKEWFKVQKGFARLVIGSRSAIFAPVSDLGLIVIDEEHEWTYKQESSPYYETHYVAQLLGGLHGAKIVLGTATPRIETLYKARLGELEYVRMENRIKDYAMPNIRVVDLREEFQRRNFSIFSQELQTKIRDRLTRKEQIILFVNQRGVARAVMCRDCGHSITCPSCEISLKLHGGSYGAAQKLICHYCSYRQDMRLNCPSCSSVNIRQVGVGTERVEEELFKLFPEARVVRADKDTTSEKTGFQPIYEAFREGRYDILVGTQMVAKGLDFPRVTLVGLVLADIGLHIPDFRSHERLFQLITQVAGRTGRGEGGGEVILQTYQPEHPAIALAARYAYVEFAEAELKFRKKLSYPPFGSMVKFTVLGSDADKLKKHIKIEEEVLQDIFKMNDLEITMLSAPAMIPKISNFYYYHVLVKGAEARNIMNHWKVPKGWRVDVDPMQTT